MYAIIYWIGDLDDEVFFVRRRQVNPKDNSDGAWLAPTLKEADKVAFKMDKKLKTECRVISIEGVKYFEDE